MENTGLSRSISRVKFKLTGLMTTNDDSIAATTTSMGTATGTGTSEEHQQPFGIRYAEDTPQMITPRHSVNSQRVSLSMTPEEMMAASSHPSSTSTTTTQIQTQTPTPTPTPPSLEDNQAPSMSSLDLDLLPPAPLTPNVVEWKTNPFGKTPMQISEDNQAKHSQVVHSVPTQNDFADAMAQSILDKVDGSTAEWTI